MTLNEKQWAFSYMVSEFIRQGRLLGYEFVGGEWQRFLDRQKKLVKKRLSKTLKSKHLPSLAIDFSVFCRLVSGEIVWMKTVKGFEDHWRTLGKLWESLGPYSEWGGRYGVKRKDYNQRIGWDPGHFCWGDRKRK